MRRISIKTRVVIWCILLVAITGAISLMIFSMGEKQMSLRYFEDTLSNAAQMAADDIQYIRGALEIDRNLDDLPNVRVVVYSLNGELIYGQERFELSFEDAAFRQAIGRTGVRWYVLDKRLDFGENPGLWLRLFISMESTENLYSHRWDLMTLSLPALLLLAAAGGYLISRNAFKPVARIAHTAESIFDGKDLKKRIGLKGSRDEIYRLASVFDDMLTRLDEAFERERRFTSDASHELRTPVAGILAQSDFALSPSADDEDRRAALLEIHRRAGDMSILIGRLLALTRMDAGHTPLRPEKVNLTMALEIAALELEDEAARKGMVILCKTDEPIEALCDQAMITQAILNMVSNAVRYGQRPDGGGTVLLNAWMDGDCACVSIRDDGPGIPEDDLPHIFERFYQADASRHQEGTGLGLALVRQIAHLHGGEVTAASIPGEGAEFILRFPAKGANL